MRLKYSNYNQLLYKKNSNIKNLQYKQQRKPNPIKNTFLQLAQIKKMQNQNPSIKNQYQYHQYLPMNDQILEKRLKSQNWNIRKEAYQQILYLIRQESSQNNLKNKVYEIGGRQYTIKKFITMFEDIVDEEHPLVLIKALQCVEILIDKKLCSGREFVKLTDQGFDKFPLRTSKGKQILQKFADIIQKIGLQQQFLLHKLNNYSAHQKCTIFALQVVSMLGMIQLLQKVKQITHKHPKNSVREVANEIYQELTELQNQQFFSQVQERQGQQIDGEQNNKKLGNKNKGNHLTFNNTPQKIKKIIKPNKKTPTKQPTTIQSNSFTRTQLDILQKVPQYQQLGSKQQQKYCEMLYQLLEKHFNKIKQGKSVPQLPMNQLSNFSYVIRIMVQSNNAIIYTCGLKILKILTQSNCPLIPRSYLLLFIFQKFRLHATHQINQLLYQLCDSLLLCNGISTTRNVDLLQAVSQGANNKKTNIKYGSFMVFLRSVAILYKNQRLFIENFSINSGQNDQGELQRFMEIYQKLNQGDVQKIKQKLIKILTKCYENFNSKMNDDKKYQQKLQDIRITMSLSYGSSVATTSNSVVSSIQNLKNKNLKKSLSQVTSKIQTYNPRVKQNIIPSSQNPINQINPSLNQKLKSTSTRTLGTYKILNPQEKLTKILTLTHNPIPNSINVIKKLIGQSIQQFQQCLLQQRFQLFYYTEIIQNFLRQYEPNDQTSDLISQYLLQILTKLSKIKNYAVTSLPPPPPPSSSSSSKPQSSNKKILIQSIRNILKICLCDLVLGNEALTDILNGFGNNIGAGVIVDGLILLDEMKTRKNKIKIKKKNKKCILNWLDQHVATEYLTDRLFQVMDKIQKGQPLGYKIQSDNQQQEIYEKKSISRQTFGRQTKKESQEKYQSIKSNNQNPPKLIKKQIEKTPDTPKLQKKITFNKNQQQTKQQKQKKHHHHNSWDDEIITLEKEMKNKNKNQRQKQKQKEGENKFNNKFLNQLYQEKQKKKNSNKKQQQIFEQKYTEINYKPKTIPKNETIFSEFAKKQICPFQQNKITPQGKIKNLYQNKDILDSQQISHIEYKQDHSVITCGLGGSTDREILSLNNEKQKNRSENMSKNTNNMQGNNQQHMNYHQYVDGEQEHNEDYQQNTNYQKYYNQYKIQQEKQRNFDLSQQNIDLNNKSIDKQSDESKDKLQQYKQYIRKIREAYLPKQYIQKEKEKEKEKQKESKQIKYESNENHGLDYSVQKQGQQQKEKSISYSVLRRQQSEHESSNEQNSQAQLILQKSEAKVEQSAPKYQYKYLNTNKLMYMLKNTTNPYSHLRNEILLPFKKLEKVIDKQFFLKEFNLFITSLALLTKGNSEDLECKISLPQPYNSLLLTIILLFSEISINRALITPLQQLYEYMASLVSTNVFIRTILGLFHSVIQQTQSNLRTFLITILTKSLSRLMPFCEDPIEILRDLGQFYNIGENVYFEMYEVEYRQICQVIEGPSLKQIVEKGLIKEGENLAVVVESMFETKLKCKIKEYIKQVIEQNQQDDENA